MQESKCKRINTRTLFGEFNIELENLELTENGLRLSCRELYKPGDDVLNDHDLKLKDVDTDECDILYTIDRNSSSILIGHRDFKNIKFPAYTPGVLAHLVEEPEGIAVDKNSVYLIGKLPQEGGKEGLIALGKKDLNVLWTILNGPEGFSLEGLKDLDMDSAGNLYILEKSRNRILKISLPRKEKFFSEIGRGKLYEPENIYVDAEGMLNVLDRISGYLVFKADGTSEKREITSSIKGMVRRRRAHDSKKNMYMISETGKRLRFLKYIEENSPDSEGVFKGTYLSKPIDSKTQNTRWYRFMLEGSFPRGTKVEFHYHISNELLEENELRELPDNEWEDGLPGSSAVQGEENRDALFLTEREGRFLRFKIVLMGTEELSPLVSSVTIFFPKVSYLDYLPSVYREDSANREFLDHFLAIFESLFFDIDFTIDNLSSWFDAAGTPPEFLEWLGSWTGSGQGQGESAARKKVPEAKQREFIFLAVSMFRERGTRQGLEKLISFYTGKTPIIIENLPISSKGDKLLNENMKEACNPERREFLFFPPEERKEKSPAGKGAGRKEVSLHESLFGEDKFSFVVLFKEKLKEADLDLVKSIVEEEKPAHTTYKVKVLEPWFYLDGHTYLGENTRLKRPEFLLGKCSVLGRDTALGVENSPDIARECLDRNHAHSTGHSTGH